MDNFSAAPFFSFFFYYASAHGEAESHSHHASPCLMSHFQSQHILNSRCCMSCTRDVPTRQAWMSLYPSPLHNKGSRQGKHLAMTAQCEASPFRAAVFLLYCTLSPMRSINPKLSPSLRSISLMVRNCGRAFAAILISDYTSSFHGLALTETSPFPYAHTSTCPSISKTLCLYTYEYKPLHARVTDTHNNYKWSL